MPVVRAVSSSRPRHIEIHGRPVLTSIVREPAAAPIHFGLGGPEGNQTAVHTEDVLATVSENYDYWTAHLRIRRDAWPDAFWGENLTLSGVSEHRLRIGDRLRIGPNAVFDVTSPRIPCFKLSWRLGQPESFLSVLTQSGRTGFYLKVTNPGRVGSGDTVVVESPYPDNITVADLSRLLHDTTASIEQLRATLSMNGLGRQAREMLSHRITHLTDGARVRRGRWTGWRRFRVTETRAESAEIRSFVLQPTDHQPIADYRAGQFLQIRLPREDGPPITRPWSLSDYAEGGSSYRVTIRHAPGGQGSSHMHTHVHEGVELDVRSPSGAFVLDRSTVFRVTLISAGIGITPLLSMLKAHAARADAPPLAWIHSSRNGATYALRPEVDRILGDHPNFSSLTLFTDPRPQDLHGRDYDQSGRLSPERLTTFLGATYRLSPFGRDIELPSQAGAFYICGPPGFERDVRAALLGWGAEPASIHSEHFTPAGGSTAPSRASCTVRFTRTRRSAQWNAEDDLSILELAEAHGLDPPSSCRIGSCHTCECTLLAGEVVYQRTPEVPAAPGRVLICCARPDAELVEIDL